MKKRTSLALILSLTALQGAQPSPDLRAQFAAIQQEKANRTPAERKIESRLLQVAREAVGKQAVEGVPSLRSRVNRRADGQVTVDISATPSPELTAAIVSAGGTVGYESPRWNSVRATVPPVALHALAAVEGVKNIRLATEPTAHTGSVTSQGDKAHRADVARTDFGVDGSGVKVGVISDSADFSANSLSTGDLPADFTVLPGRFGTGEGEGTAMSEIVHDLAPGAKISFASASGGKAFFADSILQLRAAGCDIIVDDISYPSEWQFQDDEIGKAVNQVVADGAVYLSSSGNEGNLKHGNSTTWEGDFVDGGTDALLPGGHVHSFGTQNYNTLTTSPSDVVLQWSDPYPASTNDYDVYVLNAAGTAIVSMGNDISDGTVAPIEFAKAEVGERIVILKKDGAEARYLRISCAGGPLQFQSKGQTIGHAATAKCICVASSNANIPFPDAFTTASATENSSSDGPHQMFYNPDGTPITPGNFLASTGGGNLIQSPAITGADGGVTSLALGSLNPFYGTSAAAPHCAAIAALVKSKKPSLTNSQIRTILETSTLDIESPGYDNNAGYGILMPELALVKELTPQEVWRKAEFNTYLPTGNAAPLADADGDGISNLVEYATGSNPNVADASPVSMASKSGATFSFRYHRNALATDAPVKFQTSPTLQTGSWIDVAPTSDNLISTTGNVELRSVTLPAGTDPRKFLRIEVETP